MVTGNACNRRGIPTSRPLHSQSLEHRIYLPIILSVLTDKSVDFKRAHIKFVKAGLHRCNIYFVRWINKMTCRTGETSRHPVRRYNSHVAASINDIRTYQQLVRLAVYKPVRRCSSDGTRKNLLRKIRTDTVKFVR